MNKLKSIFVMPFMGIDAFIGLYGLYQLIAHGPSLAYIGVVMATMPFAVFVLVVTMVSPRPRTSSRLPLVTILTLGGLGCSLIGFMLGEYASPMPLVLALFGATALCCIITGTAALAGQTAPSCNWMHPCQTLCCKI